MRRIPVILLVGIIFPALLLYAWSTKPEHRPDKSIPIFDPPHVRWGTDHPEFDDLGPIADFSLTERNGQTIRLEDLRGKVWVASFLFSRCCTGCPRISADLMQLQKELPDGAVIVSFTVDPEHDTPPVLKAYADGLGADPKRWLFLTGKQDEIYRLIKKSFHLGVEQNQGEARKPGNEVTHSNRLVVVDRKGHIRGWDFDGTNPDDLPRLRECIDELLREKP
jgi:cytochrome oxidase Cu insertion factor (SCO1/SenC/PrrC family)